MPDIRSILNSATDLILVMQANPIGSVLFLIFFALLCCHQCLFWLASVVVK
jgi:hypothetical protein